MGLLGSMAMARCKARTARAVSPFFSRTFPIRMYGPVDVASARWSAAAAFPHPRTSAIGYKHPPACSTPPLPPDSAPAPSETARRLPAGGTYRDTALQAAHAPAEAWDPVPPPFLRIPPQPVQNPAAATSEP